MHIVKKRLLIVLLGLLLAVSAALAAAGCAGEGVAIGQTTAQQSSGSDESSAATSDAGIQTDETAGATAGVSEAQTVSYGSEDEDASWDTSSASQITLTGEAARVDGTGATIEGSTVTITAAGSYVITGMLTDGQIVVDSADEGTVRLVLNGAAITCSDSAPIYVKNSGKTIITLAEGTENSVSDGASYVLEGSESAEPNAAIFSKDDLTINGAGSLTVDASYNDGIASKDDLKITGGTITVDAVNDAIQGKDCIGVKAGTITIVSGGDGLQATNDQDTSKGYVSIEGGTFVITSGTDAIQAQTTLVVTGGDFTITTGGGSANSSQHVGEAGNTWGDWGGSASDTGTGSAGAGAVSTTADTGSAKALKATGGIFVTGGTFSVSSSDDSIHSNGNVAIAGGTFELASGDDGVHADGTLIIDGGDLTITQSYEGLEASAVTINDGTIRVTASDDGVNVAGGMDSSSTSGRPGQNDFAVNPDNTLTINGGYIYVDSGGDGLDSNGTASLTGGTAIVNGPTNDGNGALDAQEFTITGGYLIAVGSSGMAEAPSSSSIQCSLLVNFDQAQQAGTLVHIESEDDGTVLTFAPTKQFQSVTLSSADLEEGTTYTVYLGGTATGTVTDGLYSDGTYTPGTKNVALTLSGVVTTSGATAGPGAGMGGPRH